MICFFNRTIVLPEQWWLAVGGGIKKCKSEKSFTLTFVYACLSPESDGGNEIFTGVFFLFALFFYSISDQQGIDCRFLSSKAFV
jgi:hypothetical protein